SRRRQGLKRVEGAGRRCGETWLPSSEEIVVLRATRRKQRRQRVDCSSLSGGRRENCKGRTFRLSPTCPWGVTRSVVSTSGPLSFVRDRAAISIQHLLDTNPIYYLRNSSKASAQL